jgi:predicted dehydrogenase
MARQLKTFLADVHEPLIMHYRVNAGYIPLDHWMQNPEQGGGRIIGEVCHFVDFLTFLAGALPTRVHARALPNDGRYRDDNVIITLEFADGSLGTITYVANGDKSFPKERVEVFGGGCVAVLDDFRRLELVRHGRRKVVKSRLRQDKGHRGE